MEERVDLEKLIEEFRGRENTKRFRNAIAGTFENNKSVEMAFKILKQYETLLNVCETKVEQLIGVLEKIGRCRKLERAQGHASKVLKEK